MVLFYFGCFRENSEAEGERERRTTESDTQKRGEKVWELTKTNSVLDQHKCCSFSRLG